MFRDWETAQAAAREIMQSEAGYPSVFRLSDRRKPGSCCISTA
jgi:alkyldihydroxyacetonephosphate synthase